MDNAKILAEMMGWTWTDAQLGWIDEENDTLHLAFDPEHNDTDLITLYMTESCRIAECDCACGVCVFDDEERFKLWLLGELLADMMDADNIQVGDE